MAHTAQFTHTGFAIENPSLLAAPFRDPFIFVILATYLLVAVSYAAVAGSVGGVIGRWMLRGLVEKISTS